VSQLSGVSWIRFAWSGIPYKSVNQSTWKKFVIDRGRPNKEDVEKYGAKANKEFVRQAL